MTLRHGQKSAKLGAGLFLPNGTMHMGRGELDGKGLAMASIAGLSAAD